MSLRQDFKNRAALLEHAGWDGITPRLVGLLQWMNDQPEIKKILEDLKRSGPVYEKLNAGHAHARREVASGAATPRDVASVGLAMMELCGAPIQPKPLLHQIAHSFGIQAPPNLVIPHDYLFDAAIRRFILPFLDYVMRQLPEDAPVSVKADSQFSIPSKAPAIKDARIVFVVHGRNETVRKSMFEFLRSIGLKPLEWSETVKATGEASPYIGQVLDIAFSTAQAVVVLMTPDDEAYLRKEFRLEHDEDYERKPTGQASHNVLFEAGMAMGCNPKRTIMVQLGTLRPFSDVGGRHVLRMNNSIERRQELAERLKTAGCAVDLSGRDWHTVGSFELVDPEPWTFFG